MKFRNLPKRQPQTLGNSHRRDLVPGAEQSRRCACPVSNAFSDDEGRCVKCGYPAGAEPGASTARLAHVIAGIALRDAH